MKSILILGDCFSNGSGCLNHIINNDPEDVSEWSIRFYKQYANLLKWYMAQADRRQVSAEQLIDHALKYLNRREKALSWPTMLDYEIFNRSIDGNHSARYRIQLNDHLDKHGKPDLILLSDYSWTHIFTYFTYQGHKYHFLSSPSVLKQEWTDSLGYPIEVHRRRQSEYQREMAQGQSYVTRKANRHHRKLLDDIDRLGVPYRHLIFEGNLFEDYGASVDLTDITERCRPVPDSVAIKAKTKLESQKEIAGRVRLLIEDALVGSA